MQSAEQSTWQAPGSLKQARPFVAYLARLASHYTPRLLVDLESPGSMPVATGVASSEGDDPAREIRLFLRFGNLLLQNWVWYGGPLLYSQRHGAQAVSDLEEAYTELKRIAHLHEAGANKAYQHGAIGTQEYESRQRVRQTLLHLVATVLDTVRSQANNSTLESTNQQSPDLREPAPAWSQGDFFVTPLAPANHKV